MVVFFWSCLSKTPGEGWAHNYRPDSKNVQGTVIIQSNEIATNKIEALSSIAVEIVCIGTRKGEEIRAVN